MGGRGVRAAVGSAFTCSPAAAARRHRPSNLAADGSASGLGDAKGRQGRGPAQSLVQVLQARGRARVHGKAYGWMHKG